MTDLQKRAILHVPVGISIVGLSVVHWTLPLVFTTLFLAYELNEDAHTADQAWKDILGTLWGTALSGGILLLLRGIYA